MRRASPTRVAIALGSNLGDRHAHLAWALEALRAELKSDCVLSAGVYPRLAEALARRLEATRQQLLDLYGSEQRPPW